MAHANYLNALACLLPPLLDNPVSELLRLITAFSKVTNDWINGADGCKHLIQCYHTVNPKLKRISEKQPQIFGPLNLLRCKRLLMQQVSIVQLKRILQMDHPTILRFQCPWLCTYQKSKNMFKGSDSPSLMHTLCPDSSHRSLTHQLPYNVPFSMK